MANASRRAHAEMNPPTIFLTVITFSAPLASSEAAAALGPGEEASGVEAALATAGP